MQLDLPYVDASSESACVKAKPMLTSHAVFAALWSSGTCGLN